MGQLTVLASRFRRDPEGLVVGIAAAALAIAVVAWPLSRVTYPPMTDLPMHAAQSGALRHFLDPSFHFRDQFELHPVAAPYFSTYVLGALFMLVMPASLAVRIAVGIALLMIPAGVAVLAWGMRKSPLLGLAAAPLVWCHVTHWGFINFVSAIGLDAMAVGLALRLVDRPSRRMHVALGACLVAVFSTHIFRFPYAVAGVLGAALFAAWGRSVSYGWSARAREIGRRASIVLLPMLPSLGLFAWFWSDRPRTLAPTPEEMAPTLDLGRIHEMVPYLVGGFRDPAELAAARVALGVIAGVAVAALAARWGRADASPVTDSSDRRFRRFATVAVGGNVFAMLVGYLALPIAMGAWWYIYPREITATVVLGLALLPDLPRIRGARAVAVMALAGGALWFASVSAKHFEAFERRTADFRRIITRIPKAPKLLYLVYDHSGSARTVTPWIHLPAWVQADRGGWLSFHFAAFGASPFRYRTDGGAIVAPMVPERWEWEPAQFDVMRHGRGFEWFLVRSQESPAGVFGSDPEIVPVAHDGTWWLLRRNTAK